MSRFAAFWSPERHWPRSAVTVCASQGPCISFTVYCEPFSNSVALSSAEAKLMTPEELNRIREIYEGALAMSGSDRDTFVERECHGHEEIRREVERLLKAREHIPAWLDQP